MNIKKAQAAIINVSGSNEMTLDQINKSVECIMKILPSSAEVIFGARVKNDAEIAASGHNKNIICVHVMLTGMTCEKGEEKITKNPVNDTEIAPSKTESIDANDRYASAAHKATIANSDLLSKKFQSLNQEVVDNMRTLHTRNEPQKPIYTATRSTNSDVFGSRHDTRYDQYSSFPTDTHENNDDFAQHLNQLNPYSEKKYASNFMNEDEKNTLYDDRDIKKNTPHLAENNHEYNYNHRPTASQQTQHPSQIDTQPAPAVKKSFFSSLWGKIFGEDTTQNTTPSPITKNQHLPNNAFDASHRYKTRPLKNKGSMGFEDTNKSHDAPDFLKKK